MHINNDFLTKIACHFDPFVAWGLQRVPEAPVKSTVNEHVTSHGRSHWQFGEVPSQEILAKILVL